MVLFEPPYLHLLEIVFTSHILRNEMRVLYNVFTPTRKNARLQHALQLREKENAITQMK